MGTILGTPENIPNRSRPEKMICSRVEKFILRYETLYPVL
jgi:hypothetical protein